MRACMQMRTMAMCTVRGLFHDACAVCLKAAALKAQAAGLWRDHSAPCNLDPHLKKCSMSYEATAW